MAVPFPARRSHSRPGVPFPASECSELLDPWERAAGSSPNTSQVMARFPWDASCWDDVADHTTLVRSGIQGKWCMHMHQSAPRTRCGQPHMCEKSSCSSSPLHNIIPWLGWGCPCYFVCAFITSVCPLWVTFRIAHCYQSHHWRLYRSKWRMKTVHFVGFPSQSPQICTNAGMHGWSAALVHAWLFLHLPVHEERPVNIEYRLCVCAWQRCFSKAEAFKTRVHVCERVFWLLWAFAACHCNVGDCHGQSLYLMGDACWGASTQPREEVGCSAIFSRMGGDSLLGCEVDSHDHPGL